VLQQRAGCRLGHLSPNSDLFFFAAPNRSMLNERCAFGIIPHHFTRRVPTGGVSAFICRLGECRRCDEGCALAVGGNAASKGCPTRGGDRFGDISISTGARMFPPSCHRTARRQVAPWNSPLRVEWRGRHLLVQGRYKLLFFFISMDVNMSGAIISTATGCFTAPFPPN